MPEARWKIELLGRLRASDATRTLERFQTAKTASLFAFLAVFCETPHPRESLIERFWQDSDLTQGRPSLSVALSSLRHQLEPPGTEAGSVLIANRATVQLNPHAIQTDVQQFEALISKAGTLVSEPEQITAYRDAIALYQGELFPGCYDDWCLTERNRLLELSLHAFRSLTRLLVQRREGKQALLYAQQAVAADPLREESHRDLMRILTVFGQPAAALRQYSELERLLKSELDEMPSAATRALVQEIRARLEQTDPAVAAAPKAPQTPLISQAVVAKPIPPKSPLDAQTRTILLAEWTDTVAAQEEIEAMLAPFHGRLAFLRQNVGTVLFGQASAAGRAAMALRERWRDHVRIALHTTEDESGKTHTEYLLAATHFDQILCTAETATLLRRGSAVVRSLGAFRLAVNLPPETLFALSNSETDPTLNLRPKASPGQSGNLPTMLSEFVGRENELHQLTETLAPRTAIRLLTLSGSGGIGKTRLALEAAIKLSAEYFGAVWFIPLAEASEQEHVWAAIANSMQLPQEQGKPPLEAIRELLDMQPALFLFDNLEQITEPSGAIIETLLSHCPALKCLVTSRQRLNLHAEQEFPLQTLAIPSAETTPEGAANWESIRLFVTRAQAVRPDFQLTPANTGILIELCRQLDGLPLALELAAARAQVLTPTQILERLTDRFALLSGKRRNVPARHQTLHAAIDWSYRLLSPSLQEFFLRLSVFRGGWSLEAAEEICEEQLALNLLSELCECSLVQSSQQSSEHLEMRFTVLESIRYYSVARLQESEEAEKWQDNHRQWYARFVQKFGSASRNVSLLETESANIAAALTSFVEQATQESLTSAARMTVSLCDFWERRGLLYEGRKWLRTCAAQSHTLPDISLQIALLRLAGWFTHLQGDYEEANTLSRQSLALCEGENFAEERCHILNNLALTAQSQGDFEQARTHFVASLEWAEAQGDLAKQAARLNNLGLLAIQQEEMQDAQQFLEAAARFYEQLDDVQGIAACLCNLSDLSLKRSDWTEAMRLAQESLRRFQQIGDRRGVALALTNLAEAFDADGNPQEALVTLNEAQTIASTTGLQWLLPILFDIRERAESKLGQTSH